jgi:hypothetical protein
MPPFQVKLGAADDLGVEDVLSRLDDEAPTGLLQKVGNFLDTPRRVLWTALAGRNPFPAIFDPRKGVGGDELARALGFREYAGLDIGDVLGFGAEVIADPLNFVSLGLTKAGTAGKALSQADEVAKFGKSMKSFSSLLPAQAKFVDDSVESAIETVARLRARGVEPLARGAGAQVLERGQFPPQSLTLGVPLREPQ